jgi:hypothetical protein
MKKVIFTLILIFAFLQVWGEEHEWDMEYWNEQMHYAIGPLTAEEAKQAIISWSGRQNLQIELLPVYEWERPQRGRVPSEGLNPMGHLTAYRTTLYSFFVRDPNPDKKYNGKVLVDSWTGAVKYLGKSFAPYRQNKNIANMLTPQQAINRAREIALSYFPNVPVYTFSGVKILYPNTTADGSSWKAYDDSIAVEFYNRALSPEGKEVWIGLQDVLVTIDSNTGNLLRIFCCYEPIEVSPIPNLTQEQLAQAISSFFYGLGAELVEVNDFGGRWWLEREEPYGRQRVYTLAYITAEPSPSLPQDLKQLISAINRCFVDGQTGEVFYGISEGFVGGPPIPIFQPKPKLTLIFNGQERKTKFPLRLWNGAVYISLEDIKALGFQVAKERDGYDISFGNKITKTKEIIKKEGREWVKGKTIGTLGGILVRHIPRHNVFSILILNESVFEMGKTYRKKLESAIIPSEFSFIKKFKSSSASPSQVYSHYPSIIAISLCFSSLGYLIFKVLRNILS